MAAKRRLEILLLTLSEEDTRHLERATLFMLHQMPSEAEREFNEISMEGMEAIEKLLTY